MRVCYMNVRSIRNKSLYIHDYITTHAIDIFTISETWLGTPTDDVCINELLPENYVIKRVDRQTDRAGGVAIIHRSSMAITQQSMNITYNQFEVISVILTTKNTSTNMCVFYRAPESRNNRQCLSAFMEEWRQFISVQVLTKSELLIMGDVNIHLDNPTKKYTQLFNESLSGCGLQQHIHEPTHVAGHTLDVLISRDTSGDSFISNIEVKNIGLCNNKGQLIRDHFAITYILKSEVQIHKQKSVSYRKLREINVPKFKFELKQMDTTSSSTDTVDDMTNVFHSDTSISTHP